MYKSLLLFAAVVAFACLGGCSQCGGGGCGSGAVKYCESDTLSYCDTGTTCESPAKTCNWNFFGNLCSACKTTSSSCGCNTCKTQHISCSACETCAPARVSMANTVCDTGCSGACLPYVSSRCPEACPTTSCPPASASPPASACPTTYFRSSGCASCPPTGSCPPITTQPANSFKTGNGGKTDGGGYD